MDRPLYTPSLHTLTYVLGALFFVVCRIHPVSPEAFTSIASLKALLNNEAMLLDKMEQYLEQEEARLETIRSHTSNLSRLLSVREGLSDEQWNDYVTNIVEHPIDAYNVIKDWFDVTELTTGASADLFSSVTAAADQRGVSLPQNNDYAGSITALVRLQKTYNLPTRDLAKGVIGNFTARRPMDHKDYMQMGKSYMDIDHSLANSWFELMLEEGVNDTYTQKQIFHHQMEIYKKCGDTERALLAAKAGSALDPSDEVLLSQIERLQSVHMEQLKSGELGEQHYYWRSSKQRGMDYYESLCRGENIKNTILVNKDLICVYRRGILPYVQYKEEIHSLDPRISLLYDVISDRQAELLKGKAYPSLSRAHVGDPSKSTVTDERVGKLSWLWDTDPEIKTFSQRVSDITGLATEYREALSDSEAFQIVNYGLGGQYEPHYDFYETDDMLEKLPYFLLGTGDRIATFMYYLSDVTAGGATVFPNLGIRVPPVKLATSGFAS